MGCDIHLHAEVKIAGQWHHYTEIDVIRHYGLFARLADVRNNYNIEPISQPRGLPPDVNVVTQIESNRMGGDGHSHSWISADEIKGLFEWMELQKEPYPSKVAFGFFLGNYWTDFSGDKPRVISLKVDDIRWVFWFDN